jgi:tetratricopeptide (TPR) repeat protein
LQKLTRAGELDQTSAEPYKLRGEALVSASRYAEAAESYRQALARDKNDFEVYRSLGQAYEQIGQDEQLIEIYTAALALKKDAPLQVQLARALVRTGRVDEARKNYQEALTAGDAQSAATAKQELARIANVRNTNTTKINKPVIAPTDTATPLPVQPPPVVETPKPEPPKVETPKPEPPKPTISAQEHIQRGIKLKEAGDSAGALREYQAALKQDSSKVDAYYLIGIIYEQQGDFDAAMTAFERCQSGPYAGVSRSHMEMIRKKRKK